MDFTNQAGLPPSGKALQILAGNGGGHLEFVAVPLIRPLGHCHLTCSAALVYCTRDWPVVASETGEKGRCPPPRPSCARRIPAMTVGDTDAAALT